MSVFVPVDPVPLKWTLEFVAVSHLRDWYLSRTFLKKEPKWFAEVSLMEAPDIEADQDKYRILSCSLEPGAAAVAVHILTLHAGPGTEVLCCVFLYASFEMISDIPHAFGKLLQSSQDSPQNLEMVYRWIINFSRLSALQILHNFFFIKTQ
ncbi:MAG: hypothetical protein VYC02_03335 [SAR324 cluster bacterium]|nr:hypothetical protein [SAR324 cluster bacterium]MED5240654.1 hypothetical protein [SAR324 cluster bacterium]